jgi:hypothetical protein
MGASHAPKRSGALRSSRALVAQKMLFPDEPRARAWHGTPTAAPQQGMQQDWPGGGGAAGAGCMPRWAGRMPGWDWTL